MASIQLYYVEAKASPVTEFGSSDKDFSRTASKGIMTLEKWF
jgi:hypothetical protein